MLEMMEYGGKPMTVGELKAALSDVPDGMKILIADGIAMFPECKTVKMHDATHVFVNETGTLYAPKISRPAGHQVFVLWT